MTSVANQKPARILCIQLKQLGDVLMTTPAVRALAQSYPDSEIDFITQKPSDTIFEPSPYVAKVYRVRWTLREQLALLAEVRRKRYDVLIDFSGSSKTAHFARLTGISRRIGIAGKKRSWCFTDAVPVPQEVDYTAARKLSLLAVLGLQPHDASLDFFVPDVERRKFDARFERWKVAKRPIFAISPVSKRAFKVWPAERFAKLCDLLVERHDGQIFFLIGPGEMHFAERVRDQMQHECLPIVDDLNLYEAASLLDRASCYVGNDNGLMHLSVARKRPTFAVFGRHSPRAWQAPTMLHETIDFDPGCKSRCYYPGCKLECLTGISVEAAWRRLDAFLARGENPA